MAGSHDLVTLFRLPISRMQAALDLAMSHKSAVCGIAFHDALYGTYSYTIVSSFRA